MGMAHEGGACVWRGLVCVTYRWGSECLSDTPQTTKKILIHRKNIEVWERKERMERRETEKLTVTGEKEESVTGKSRRLGERERERERD